MLPDTDRVTRLIEEAAAAEIMPRFRQLAAGDVREKAPGDLVTVADEAVEARLAPLLTSLVPGSIVVGEEGAASDPSLLNRLLDDQPLWIIDPVDGTNNFAEGKPAFAVMVALARGRDVLAAWIHDPVAVRTAVAAAGEGAWLGDRRLRVASAPAVPGDMTGVLLSGFFGNRELSRKIDARRNRVRAIRSARCAGIEYLRLAAGDMHFSLFTKLMPWDHAPGVLLHREAGGHAAYLEGGAYEPAAIKRSGLLLAPDPDSWQRLHTLLLGDD
ncbi:MAG TPA: inositol monophosphatase [Candidatus Acidoferrum sp.]|nr:inositol monophosphatase [Candidatus Acidoferrum sp.]